MTRQNEPSTWFLAFAYGDEWFGLLTRAKALRLCGWEVALPGDDLFIAPEEAGFVLGGIGGEPDDAVGAFFD
jgi:hypothetical protein